MLLQQNQAPATQTGMPGHPGPPQLANPFAKAAREHVELIFDVSRVPSAAISSLGNGVLEVPAYGYLRHLVFLVESTGGAGAAVVAADAPWNILTDVALTDVNGQFIFGPYTGFEMYLVHLFGGYNFDPDPTRSPAYSAPDTGGNFSFLLRLPCEITGTDGLGALANQNASSTFKVRLSLNSTTAVFTTAPTTLPTVRVRCYLEAWTQPNATDSLGVPNQLTPPALGTVQNWSKEDKVINAGSQTPRLSRVGNALRNIVCVTKDATGARIGTMFPDPINFQWDGRQLFAVPVKLQRHYMQERYGVSAASLPVGVYVFDFTHDADYHCGNELRQEYLTTTQASRIELQGVYGAAGTMTILTNDVLAFADAAL